MTAGEDTNSLDATGHHIQAVTQVKLLQFTVQEVTKVMRRAAGVSPQYDTIRLMSQALVTVPG